MLFQPRHAILLLLTLFLPASASAKPVSHQPAARTPPARRELQAIYNHMNAEAMQRNVDGLYEYDSDDYAIFDTKGHAEDPAQGRQALETVLDKVDTIRAVSVIQGFTGTETEATVTLKDHYQLGMANQTTGRALKFVSDDTARDHWVKTEDGWRRTRTRILSGSHTLKKNF